MTNGTMLAELRALAADDNIRGRDIVRLLRLSLAAQADILERLDALQGQMHSHTHPEFKTMAGRDWITAVVAMVGAAFAVWLKR